MHCKARSGSQSSFPCASPIPAPNKKGKVLLAPDERRENPGSLPAASTAHAEHAIERHRRRHTLQLMQALVLDNEESGDLPLDRRSDQHCSRLGRGLNPRSDVGRFAEYLARRIDDDRAAFESNAGREFRRAGLSVSRIYVGYCALDGQRGPHGAFGVILLRLRVSEQGHQPVAELLQHVSAKRGHRLRRFVEIRVDEVPPVLGVKLGRKARRSDEIAEHDRDRSPLG